VHDAPRKHEDDGESVHILSNGLGRRRGCPRDERRDHEKAEDDDGEANASVHDDLLVAGDLTTTPKFDDGGLLVFAPGRFDQGDDSEFDDANDSLETSRVCGRANADFVPRRRNLDASLREFIVDVVRHGPSLRVL
jgi:hypothetical protein